MNSRHALRFSGCLTVNKLSSALPFLQHALVGEGSTGTWAFELAVADGVGLIQVHTSLYNDTYPE